MFNHCEVNIVTGEVTHETTDLDLPSRIPLRLTRRYSSASPVAGPLGWGWLNNFAPIGTLLPNRFVQHDPFSGDAEIELGPVNSERPFASLVRPDTRGQAPARPLRGTAPANDEAIVVDHPDASRDIYLRDPRTPDRWFLAGRRDGDDSRILYRYAGPMLISIELPEGNVVRMKYDSAGRVVRLVYGRGTEGQPLVDLSYIYDSEGNLVRFVGEGGAAVEYEYADHLLVRSVDPMGTGRNYAYDAQGRCVRVWYDGGAYTRALAFDARRRQVMVTDSYGRRALYRCTENGDIEFYVDPLGQETQRILNADGGLLATIDPDGSISDLFAFDSASGELTESDGAGGVWRTRLGARGELLQIVAPSGCVRRHEYDERGRLVGIVLPNGGAIRYHYGRFGFADSMVDPLGYEIQTEISADGLLVRFWDDLGTLYEQRFDAIGNLMAEVDAAGRETRFSYAVTDLIATESGPDGAIDRYQYDRALNMVQHTDPLGRARRTEYDGVGNITAEIDPIGLRVEYVHDLEGNLLRVVNEKGETLEVEYDGLYREVATTFFDGRTLRYEVDAEGRRTAIIDALGKRTELSYQRGSDVHRRVFPDGATEEYVLNADSRFASIRLTEPQSSGLPPREAIFTYDVNGSIASTTHEGRTVEYAWNLANRLVAVRDSFGDETEILRGARHRATSLRVRGREFGFEYLPAGELSEIVYPNGMRQRFSYDRAGWMNERSVVGPRDEIRAWRRFSYDAAHQLVELSDWHWGTFRYRYDSRGSLIEVVGRDDARSERYDYDPAGNLITGPRGTARIGRGNRLQSMGDQEFEYDHEGQMVLRRDGPSVWRYSWNRDGQLARVERDGGIIAEYEYDLLNRRCTKRTAEGRTEFLYDTYALRAEVLPNGTRIHYVSLPGIPIPIARCEGDRWLYFAYDQIGTPTEAYDDAGQLVVSSWCTAYGDARESYHPQGGIAAIPFGFLGQYLDAETGLVYNHHRVYDPRLGRYLSQDPLRLNGGTNFYVYPANPTGAVDPLGLVAGVTFTCPSHWGACQQWYARQKVARINRASRQRILRKTCTTCPDPTKSRKNKQRSDFEGKCGGGPGSAGVGRQIDHMHELQAAGYDRCCNNLRSVEENYNNEMGKVFQNETLAGLSPGQWIGHIKTIGCSTRGKCSKAGQRAVAVPPPKANQKCSKEDSKPIRC